MTGIEGTKENKDTAFILWNLYFSGRRYIKKDVTNQVGQVSEHKRKFIVGLERTQAIAS